MYTEDHLASPSNLQHANVFDPDNVITEALFNQLASATSTPSQTLCQPFIRSGIIITDTDPILFDRGLLDTGAQGSNFVSREVYDRLPSAITDLSRSIHRIVRLGDARSLSIELEVPLTVGILDSAKNNHQHCLWYSVLDVLSHDIIIGLVDLIGPFYDLFADSVTKSRELSITKDLRSHLKDLTVEIQALHSECNPQDIERANRSLQQHNAAYHQQKQDLRQCKHPHRATCSPGWNDYRYINASSSWPRFC
jgi:hypothetical protein